MMETVPAVEIEDGVRGIRRAAEEMQFVVIIGGQEQGAGLVRGR